METKKTPSGRKARPAAQLNTWTHRIRSANYWHSWFITVVINPGSERGPLGVMHKAISPPHVPQSSVSVLVPQCQANKTVESDNLLEALTQFKDKDITKQRTNRTRRVNWLNKNKINGWSYIKKNVPDQLFSRELLRKQCRPQLSGRVFIGTSMKKRRLAVTHTLFTAFMCTTT